MDLQVWGRIGQETTKVDDEGERTTTFQVKSDMTREQAADLQGLMGSQLYIIIEDMATYKVNKQERAGQLRLPLDGAAAPEVCAVCGHTASCHGSGVCDGAAGTCECTGYEAAPDVREPARCVVCGHSGQLHTGPEGGCIGDEGMCTCAAFAAAPEADAASGEHAEPDETGVTQLEELWQEATGGESKKASEEGTNGVAA